MLPSKWYTVKLRERGRLPFLAGDPAPPLPSLSTTIYDGRRRRRPLRARPRNRLTGRNDFVRVRLRMERLTL